MDFHGLMGGVPLLPLARQLLQHPDASNGIQKNCLKRFILREYSRVCVGMTSGYYYPKKKKKQALPIEELAYFTVRQNIYSR